MYTFTMYPGIKERLNVYLNLCMNTVQLNFTFSIYSLSWGGSHYILCICENTVCHGMVPITFCASVRISTVFAKFALKTSVEISTN